MQEEQAGQPPLNLEMDIKKSSLVLVWELEDFYMLQLIKYRLMIYYLSKVGDFKWLVYFNAIHLEALEFLNNYPPLYYMLAVVIVLLVLLTKELEFSG